MMKLAIYKKRPKRAQPASFSSSWSIAEGREEEFTLSYGQLIGDYEDNNQVHVIARFTRGEIESLITRYQRMLAEHPAPEVRA